MLSYGTWQRRQVHLRYRSRFYGTSLCAANPTAFLDKIFIGHLHGDHFGDFGSLFVAGGIPGRFSPLRIWSPSGATPELGTKAAIEAMEKIYGWDIAGRLGQTDLATHECFIAVPDLVAKYRLTPEAALQVGTQIHTAPKAFGKVMSMVKPRHAVAYHFFKDADTTGPVLESAWRSSTSIRRILRWRILPNRYPLKPALVTHRRLKPDGSIWPMCSNPYIKKSAT